MLEFLKWSVESGWHFGATLVYMLFLLALAEVFAGAMRRPPR